MQYRTDEQEDKSDISTKTYYLVELHLYETESHLNKYKTIITSLNQECNINLI